MSNEFFNCEYIFKVPNQVLVSDWLLMSPYSVQKLFSKTDGKVVGYLMTPAPMVVREATNLEDASRLLLQTKYNLLSVVNGDGKLVGIITLGNVVRAALQFKQDEELRSLSICKKLEVRHTTHARKRFREFERTSGEANVSY
ncbi:CBS domain-containing protein CBSX1, chloroplastic-like isoform X2 [Primulina huaijiensis]|uniref:CBS domain-containing protein CBSX1, chloroplastic-like isoform X2 n=1 Tax=Primulina huaijiensis TaxID=1492673 RepID=UPI003CC6E986